MGGSIRDLEINDIEEDEFIEYQKKLSVILNNGYPIIAKTDQYSTVMNIGSSGSGKSTTSNLLFGSTFHAEPNGEDVTKEFSEPHTPSKYPNLKVVDCVGFTPNPRNIGKMIILFFHCGFFPDYLLYPANTGRVVEIDSLMTLVNAELIKVLVIPFNSSGYYTTKEVYIEQGLPEELAIKKSIEKSFNKNIITNLKAISSISNSRGNVAILESMDNVPKISGSMKDQFILKFFEKDKYVEVSYKEHKESLNKKEALAIVRASLLGAVKDLKDFSKTNSNGLIISIDQCKYLKDSI